jgi:hypothetical protein
MTGRDDWDQVADAVGALALKLKLHLEEAASGSVDDARLAVDAVADGVEAAFDGLKSAINDPAVKQDIQTVASGFHDALANTFAELSATGRAATHR